jgi:hypothetical protein
MKKRKATPVFRCSPNGEMHDIVDGVLIPKVVKKINKYLKTKSNGNNIQNQQIPKIK